MASVRRMAFAELKVIPLFYKNIQKKSDFNTLYK
jgi:hypothetical protein